MMAVFSIATSTIFEQPNAAGSDMPQYLPRPAIVPIAWLVERLAFAALPMMHSETVRLRVVPAPVGILEERTKEDATFGLADGGRQATSTSLMMMTT